MSEKQCKKQKKTPNPQRIAENKKRRIEKERARQAALAGREVQKGFARLMRRAEERELVIHEAAQVPRQSLYEQALEEEKEWQNF